MNLDYSTINRGVLDSLPDARVAAQFRLQEHPGNGCHGDPPGYPSYFTQCVYTPGGNTPSTGSEMVLLGKEVARAEGDWDIETRNALLRALYVPLPFDHPRVKAWVVRTFEHLNSCYRDVEREEYGRPGLLIYPVPSYKLKSYHFDTRWQDFYIAAHKQEVDAFNLQEQQRAALIAIPENHLAVIKVRETYPGQNPSALFNEIAPRLKAELGHRPGDWWERTAERPTPATCPGLEWNNQRHRSDGWCQRCGYTNDGGI